MQHHVKLEIALEVIINKIANVMNKIKTIKDENESRKLEEYLKKLLDLKERAYKGDFDAVEQILESKKEV